MSLPAPLAPLGAYRQFIVYRLEPRANSVKMDKVPCSPDGNTASALDPKNWLSHAEAETRATILGGNYGVGFVLTEQDPFCCIDLDNCWLGDRWSDLALQIIEMLPGAAVEVSQSGTGLHIWCSYIGDPPEHTCKNVELGIELYTSGRFIALGGHDVTGSLQ